MRTVLFAAAIVLTLCSSCTNYQYVQVKSELPQTADTKHYYQSDEHLYVDYDFAGYALPVNLFLVNESSEMVYFDLVNTTFLENGEFVATAFDLSNDQKTWTIEIAPSESITFQCFPFYREYNGFLTAGSEKKRINHESGYDYVRVTQFEPGDRSFTIKIAYRIGDESADHEVLEATFWEDSHTFSTKSPQNFPTALNSNVYVLDDNNVAGQIATELLYEAVSASLAYLIYTGID